VTLADETERWLRARTTQTIMPVEDVAVESHGELTAVTFFTEVGAAVAVFNKSGVLDLIRKLESQYFK
jgi:hypothetical protein